MNARRAIRRLITFLGLAVIAILLAAPGRAADGRDKQTRSVGAFDRIRLQGAFDVTVTAGAAHTAVIVSATSGVIDRVTTEVRGGELVVGMKPGTNNLFGSTPRLDISLPALHGFANEGAGSAKIGGLAGGNLDISNAGTATIVATGRSDTVTIALNGTGRIDTTGLAARDVTVDNNGVGSVRVRASGQLTMSVNGVGEIRYAGNPAKVDSHVNGIGHIAPL